jgi:Type II secretion system (T2SS), protein M subtype b
MTARSLASWVAALQTQWSGNSRLRWGLLAIGALLWTQGLLVASDATQRWRSEAAALREEASSTLPLARSKVWPGRADDARQQSSALRSMLWTEGDRGLAEAAIQDWLRLLAGKAGVGIRELAVARPAAVAQPASAPAALPAGVQPVRLRLSVDFNRLALMAFLAELARNEQVVVVERLVLRPASQPPSAEMDLRMLVTDKARAK